MLENKGRGGLRSLRCAAEPLVKNYHARVRRIFSLTYGTFLEAVLGYEAQASSVFVGSAEFPEQRFFFFFFEREKLNSTAASTGALGRSSRVESSRAGAQDNKNQVLLLKVRQ